MRAISPLRPAAWLRPALIAATALALAAGTVGGLLLTPPDAFQGDAQRIMYVHVPSAWTAYLAFFVTFVASGLYLWKRDLRWDRLAAAAAELGVVFTALAIVLGSVWGKPVWGVWWTWDPRLTTTAILLTIFTGYLMLRAAHDDVVARARRAAVLGLIGFADVPVIHLSVTWWRSLHQPPTVLAPNGGKPSLAPVMGAELGLMVVAFTLLFALLLWYRLDLGRAEQETELAWQEEEPSQPSPQASGSR